MVPSANAGGFWGGPSPGINFEMTAAQAQAAVENGLRTNNVLFPYASSIAVYHCPGDERHKLRPAAVGPTIAIRRLRTSAAKAGSTTGGWVPPIPISQVFVPSKTLCFMEDADERSYNVGPWVVRWNTGTATFSWVIPPALFHGTVSTVAFADGSAGTHRWQDERVIQAGRKAATGQNPSFGAYSSASVLDSQFIHDNLRFPGWQ